ncbi:Uncharacterised protein [Clostridium perfringens]|nr:Uncharacterised protein [Clostridium perfringens]
MKDVPSNSLVVGKSCIIKKGELNEDKCYCSSVQCSKLFRRMY